MEAEADEVPVAGVPPLERPREPAAKRVIAGGERERELDLEAVALEQLLQGHERNHVDVLPGLHVIVR